MIKITSYYLILSIIKDSFIPFTHINASSKKIMIFNKINNNILMRRFAQILNCRVVSSSSISIGEREATLVIASTYLLLSLGMFSI